MITLRGFIKCLVAFENASQTVVTKDLQAPQSSVLDKSCVVDVTTLSWLYPGCMAELRGVVTTQTNTTSREENDVICFHHVFQLCLKFMYSSTIWVNTAYKTRHLA